MKNKIRQYYLWLRQLLADKRKNRFPSLDGWRGISILFVLAAHLFPLGPKQWQMNSAVAVTGMVIFFNLSGFLITTILLRDRNIPYFLLRRFLRIVPLAWLVIFVTFTTLHQTSSHVWLSHLFFYANFVHPMTLTAETSHYWSLCVEMQFYLLVTALVLVFKRYAFYLLPVFGIGATLFRVYDGVGVTIVTYYRMDEIFAGCILALLYAKKDNNLVKNIFSHLNPVVLLPFVLLSSHPLAGPWQYFRPYFAMMLLGSTLFNLEKKGYRWNKLLSSTNLQYIATISYALYIIHGGLRFSWLGSGGKLMRYLKRPLLLAVVFVLAHLSTFHYERHWLTWGKSMRKYFPKVE
ncbi:MAG TPA: acyltransferase [Gammaproteobacteria bacterium]|nr:acyltransferase [Gammaproteobacteria bacterium]